MSDTLIHTPVRLLLVEDNPQDAALLEEYLSEATGFNTTLSQVNRLDDALAQITREVYDVILLDLSLPDSWGLETIEAVLQTAQAPVIVLTVLADEELAVKAIQKGAQDYLVKSDLHPALMNRAIRYALERHRLLEALEAANTRQCRLQEAERKTLDRFAQQPPVPVTASTFGRTPLHDAVPDLFNEITGRYAGVMDTALKNRIYRDHQDLGEPLQKIAYHIGQLKGGPRDVVQIHTAALDKKLNHMPQQKAQVYLEESRMLVLELMGDLADYYRSRAYFNIQRPDSRYVEPYSQK